MISLTSERGHSTHINGMFLTLVTAKCGQTSKVNRNEDERRYICNFENC